jgi:hypothetical protein
MDEVRPLLAPLTHQTATGRQPEFEAGVAGQRHAGQRQLMFAARISPALPRPDHADQMAARAQATHQPAYCHRHAIDLRREGFGDEGDGE